MQVDNMTPAFLTCHSDVMLYASSGTRHEIQQIVKIDLFVS